MNVQVYAEALARVAATRPLVHHITNYVTVNDCANITLSIGGSPVMADAIEEVDEMTGIAGALVLNIGTLNERVLESMLRAGKAANRKLAPVVLDPVGVGATRMRTDAARRILGALKIAVIKGNAGEIGVLAGTGGSVRGVDSAGTAADPTSTARTFATVTGAVVAITGPVDIVSDGKRTVLVENGHPIMAKVSGTGCMAASLTGAFCAANKDPLVATTAALACLGVAGERAASKAAGPGTFKAALIDAIAQMTPADLTNHARLREI